MNKLEVMMVECPICKGTGKRADNTKCKKCNGKGTVQEDSVNSTILRG